MTLFSSIRWTRSGRLAALLCTISLGAPAPAATLSASQLQAARLNNIGTALMNQQLLERAQTKFAEAYAADPSLTLARLNQGVALLYLQKMPEAEAALKQAAAAAPGDPRSWYALGLLYRSESQPEPAFQAFRKVLELDPKNADSQYFLGSIELERSHLPEAATAYHAALAISPLHASAEFGLARALQRMGKADEARAAFERFQHITHDKLGFPMSHNYGEEGAYGRVEDASAAPVRVAPMIPVRFRPSWQSTPQAAGSSRTGGACLLPSDGVGSSARPSLVVVGRGEHAVTILRNTSTAGKAGYEALSPADTGVDVSGNGVGCAVGDYDNDGLADLAIALDDRILLFRNSGGGRFQNVTAAAGIKPANRPSGVLFVDYDHDGDLDLFVIGTATTSTPNALYRNNGDKTFTDWTTETALGGQAAAPTAAAQLSDLNDDRAVDLVTAGAAGPLIYTNPREGAFTASPLAGAPRASTSLAVLDFDKDGRMDIAVGSASGLALWRNVDGKRFAPASLPPLGGSVRAITPIDFDNDGWIDLIALVTGADGSHLRALRNVGPDGFVDATAALGLDSLPPTAATALLAADVDGDNAADLILTGPNGTAQVLHNDGGNRNHALRIALKGVADNRSAIGAKVEVFGNGLWQKWEATGQPEILAGLGAADSADLVRLLWPTGVPQDELEVAVSTDGAAAKPLLLTETDRRGSSCPTLFAWNGARYSFVTDVIGAGVVGHWVSPTARNTPNPEEWVKVSGSQLQARDGLLSLRFGEPMEEVNFVDQVRLVAVDHPADSSATPNEGFLSKPPFAPARAQTVVVSHDTRPPAGAWDDQGRDVLATLRDQDHSYVRDFTNLPYAGFANRHTLTLDLGDASPAQSLKLLLHGFVEYFSASSMYAAWQAGIAPIPPYVEAQRADGSWQRILDDMGFPAGLPRTVVVDLTGKLPPGATRVRILTNLQIYWDQVLIDRSADAPEQGERYRTTELPLASARLAFRGYPRQIDGKTPGDLTYDYTRISRTGPFVPQRGAYTRYGDVTPLLAQVDDRYVIFGTGEDMDLEFAAASLPPLAAGWTRDYFFYANGYVKDMDFYEASPFTVDSLPFHAMSSYPYRADEHYPADAAQTAYQLEWNTRFESGTRPREYRFDYQPGLLTPETGAR